MKKKFYQISFNWRGVKICRRSMSYNTGKDVITVSKGWKEYEVDKVMYRGNTYTVFTKTKKDIKKSLKKIFSMAIDKEEDKILNIDLQLSEAKVNLGHLKGLESNIDEYLKDIKEEK